MSRSGYSDECYGSDLAMWRGAVNSAMRGKRGQAFLVELLATLDAMPIKRLVANELEAAGEVCALGSVGRARGIDQTAINPEDHEVVAKTFGIAPAMAAEIMFMNDDDFHYDSQESPERRWTRVRKWVAGQIIESKP